MWARGRLDIENRDLIFAAFAVLLGGAAPRRVWPTEEPHLALWSVRTAWDALLSVKNWPRDDEIICSQATIPDMVRLIELHGLVPVFVSLDPLTLEVDAHEVTALVTSRTRAF